MPIQRSSPQLLPVHDAPPPIDEAGAACLDALSSEGRWYPSTSAQYGDGWEYRNPDRDSRCQLMSSAKAARDAAARRWLLVVGDSRARAQLALPYSQFADALVTQSLSAPSAFSFTWFGTLVVVAVAGLLLTVLELLPQRNTDGAFDSYLLFERTTDRLRHEAWLERADARCALCRWRLRKPLRECHLLL